MHPAERARAAFLLYRDTGGPEALSQVFDLCAQELLLVAHHLARPGVAPEDLLQSTFLGAIRKADQYDAERPLMPWLCGILVNVARTHNREVARRLDAELLRSGPVDDPADLAYAREFAAAVASAIEELPQQQREVLTLRLVHGLSPTEIAHALGAPVGTVKSWIHRGVERLKQVLPAGFAASLALIVGAEQAVAAMRERVLQEAARLADVDRAVPHFAPESPRPPLRMTRPATGAMLGGLGVLLGVIVWVASTRSPAQPSDAVDRPLVAITAAADQRIDSRSQEVSPAVDARSHASAAGGLRIRARFASDGAPAAIAVRIEPRFGDEPVLRARTIRTDDQGRAQVADLPAGPYALVPDRGAPMAVLVPERGAEVEIELPPALAVAGRVRDSTGQPVARARLWLSSHGRLGEGECVAETDAEGRFTLRDVPANRALAVLADGFACSELRLIRAPAGERDRGPLDHLEPAATVGDAAGMSAVCTLDFELREPAATITGRVIDEAGLPAPAAHVQIGATFDPAWNPLMCLTHKLYPPQTVFTDASGRFECRSVRPGNFVRIWARAEGTAARRGTVRAIQGETPATIALERGGRWRGRVTDREGSVAAASVTATSLALAPDAEADREPRWALPAAFADLDGEFAITGLSPGAALLRAEGEDASWDVREEDVISGAEIEWSPQLGSGHRLEGQARSQSGSPLSGYRVAAIAPMCALRWTTVDDEGVFELDGLEDRLFTVWLHGPEGGYPGTLTHAAGVRPDEKNFELLMPDARRPSGFLIAKVLDRSGAPLARVCATAVRDHTIVPGTRDPEGRCRIGPLPPGDYYLTVSGDHGLAFLHGPLTVRADEELDCGVLNQRPGGRVQVRVDGDPTPEAIPVSLLTLEGALAPTFFVARGGDGTSLPVPPGRYRLSVIDPVFGAVQQTVDVLEGALAEVVVRKPACVPVELFVSHPELCRGVSLHVSWQRAGAGDPIRIRLAVAQVTAGTTLSHWSLEPGRYVVDVESCEGLRGRAEIELRADSAAPECRVELR